MKHRYYLFSLVLFLLSVFFFLFPPAYRFISAHSVMSQGNPIVVQKELTQKQSIGEIPQRIVIPAIGIDLPIVPAKVVNGYWELSDTTASYGLGSGLPGTTGNTVIFAHAREHLFLHLRQAHIGNVIFVYTKSHSYAYIIKNIQTVYPTNIAVIGPTSNETVTLFTCSGFMDSKRLIVVAKPLKT